MVVLKHAMRVPNQDPPNDDVVPQHERMRADASYARDADVGSESEYTAVAAPQRRD